MNNNNEIMHSFSRAVAKKYGVNAAIVLSYIGYKIERSKHIHDGRRWFYETYDGLTEHYPYLKRNAVYEAVQRLIIADGPLTTGNYNKWKQDRTTWYAFKDERTIQTLQAEPIYYKSCDAAAFGLVAAVLINNLAYWIKENREKNPDYQYHPVSARRLEKHIPFSHSSIQRAFDNLVKNKVLVSRQEDGKLTGYAFVEPDQAGSKPNMVELDKNQADPNPNKAGSKPNIEAGDGPTPNKTGSNPNLVVGGPIPNIEAIGGPDPNIVGSGSEPNMGGSNPNMHGSIPKMGGSEPNMGGSKPNDITILIDTCLEDPCLKEACLKENHFKTPVSFFSSNTLPANAKSEQLPGQNEVVNCFAENIADPIPDQTNQQKLNGLIDSATVAVPDTVPDPSPEPLPTSEVGHPDWPEHRFLDRVVHDCCWSVFKEHDQNKADPIYKGLAEHIVGRIQELIDQTEPEKVYRLYKIKTQAELNAELAVWSSSYFANVYDTHYTMPDQPNNAAYREMFINHAHCFLNMGFHSIIFDGRPVYCGLNYHQIGYAVLCKITPWAEQRQEQQRQENIAKRAIEYVSPDRDKESDASLSAGEKMQVFNQSLQARNRIGRFDEWGHFLEDVVLIQRNSLNLARQFFQLNAALTPTHLNQVLDECIKLPRTIDGLDPVWHAKNGYKISFLLNNLGTIAGQVNMLSKLPAFTPLPQAEDDQQPANLKIAKTMIKDTQYD